MAVIDDARRADELSASDDDVDAAELNSPRDDCGATQRTLWSTGAEVDLVAVLSDDAIDGVTQFAFHDLRDEQQPLSILTALDESHDAVRTMPMFYSRRKP